uniref:Arginase n=1 Tax=Rhabditophanes sp. KR3021 TaxID=114890 RepID=A0AC35TNE6_9BILA
MRRSLQLLSKTLNVVGLSNGHGGRYLGCEKAVKVLQESEIFNQCNIPFKWGTVINETVTGTSTKALDGIISNSQKLADATGKLFAAKKEMLVIGGDHSCAIGTWSGVASAARTQGDVGLIWVDAHMDAHTLDSSDTGNIHGMPVAHLLGYGNSKLASIGDDFPAIKPSNLALIGIRSFEPAEQKLLESLGAKIFYMKDIHEKGFDHCMSEAIKSVTSNTIGFGLSIDLDGFRVEDAPAVGTPEDDGIVADEFLKFFKNNQFDNLIATEIVEFMPRKDDENKKSEHLVKHLVESIYFKKFDSKQ